MVLTDIRNSARNLGEITRQGYEQGYADTQIRTGARSSLYDPLAYATLLTGTLAGYQGMHHLYTHYLTQAPRWGEWLLHGEGTLIGFMAAGIVAPTIARYVPDIMIGTAELIGSVGGAIKNRQKEKW